MDQSPGVERGLCGDCAHARLNTVRRGTTYLRCALAADNPRFARYPTLPVRRCPGHQPATQHPRVTP